MIIIDSKPDGPEPIEDSLQNAGGDLPPAYDALSIHQPQRNEGPHASFTAFPEPVAGSSRNLYALADSSAHRVHLPVLNTNKLLPVQPPSSPKDSLTTLPNGSTLRLQKPRARKHTSWLSLLPFASTFSAKRVRQSVLSIVSDLVVSPSHASIKEQRNVHEVLSSVAETCSEHKLSLSTLLQEASIADHTPIYWAVVNYREELLVALLLYSRPLTIETISDVRRACLVGSNQALFHALRVCSPPFHMTDGIQVPSLRTASENLLLGYRPLDYIQIQQSNDQGFVVSFDIALWQSRMKALGCVSIEFIVCGRMWSVTFFSAYPIKTTSGKAKRGKDLWYTVVRLLESSPPTFLDSRLTVEVPSSSIPTTTQTTPKPREVRSMMFTSVRDKQHPNRSSMYDSGYGGMAHARTFPSEVEGNTSVISSYLPPPSHPLRGSFPSSGLGSAALTPLSIRLQAGNRKLGCRTKSGEHPNQVETPTVKPETWSDRGVGYTSAAVSPLQEGHMSLLLCENSRYLLPDGTLRGRLEARLARPKSSKDCVIC